MVPAAVASAIGGVSQAVPSGIGSVDTSQPLVPGEVAPPGARGGGGGGGKLEVAGDPGAAPVGGAEPVLDWAMYEGGGGGRSGAGCDPSGGVNDADAGGPDVPVGPVGGLATPWPVPLLADAAAPAAPAATAPAATSAAAPEAGSLVAGPGAREGATDGGGGPPAGPAGGGGDEAAGGGGGAAAVGEAAADDDAADGPLYRNSHAGSAWSR